MNGPAPTLVTDWVTPGFTFFIAFLFVFVMLLLTAARMVKADRLRAMDLAKMDEQVRVERHCVQHGHNLRKIQTPTRWRCTHCHEVTESQPGWVDGGAA